MHRLLTTKPNWFRLGSSVFLAWTAVNTYLSLSRYGWDQGMYWWFCNLAMAGVAVALWLRHSGILIGWISIALFTQTFWVFDNLYRVATGSNLFGLVEFMYQPGLPMDEFVVSHYHFFILPAALFALFFLEEKKVPMWVVVFINALIFGVSYFVFPAAQNINCIHAPCAPAIQHWAGTTYSIAFFAIVCSFCLAVSRGLFCFYRRVRPGPRGKAQLTWLFIVFCLLGVAVSVYDVRYKRSIPAFSCAEPFEDDRVRVACDFTLDHAEKVMALVYRVDNRLDRTQLCTSFLEHDGQNEVLSSGIVVGARKKLKLTTFVSYPTEEVRAHVWADCRPFDPVRTPTGK